MKLMKTEDAVGQVLYHDITQIIKGVTKDAVFRKGHVIKEEDIPVLLSVGKDHVFIWENDENMLHENDAAEILRDICMGENISASKPKEGKIELIADIDGMLTIDVARLNTVNALGEMMIATRHGGYAVKKGDKLAGTRVIPLTIHKDKMAKAKEAAEDKPLLNVKPFTKKKVGVITTGNEVFLGRIKDTFTPVIADKFAEFGSQIDWHMVLGDSSEKITAAIREMLDAGMDIVVCTGGMSVDPDDRTPLAIRSSGVQIVTYGAPVLPGTMFILAYTEDGRAMMGLPGCVMYAHRTIFDLVLPSIMSNVRVTAEQLVQYGEGGLCLNCGECHFPNCAFGK
ncbi:MAG: molybdopterin-binding protein [Christensenellales bacterium]|jgi:molybdenum cofactor synthesis domain-containing protein